MPLERLKQRHHKGSIELRTFFGLIAAAASMGVVTQSSRSHSRSQEQQGWRSRM
jgi:hypothetical protein